MLEPVILPAAPARLVGRVLGPAAFELVEHDLLGVEVELVGEHEAVTEHVGEFVAHGFGVGVGVPLVALEQLGGLDGDALGEVLGGVELCPVPLGHERAEGVAGGVGHARHASRGEFASSRESQPGSALRLPIIG